MAKAAAKYTKQDKFMADGVIVDTEKGTLPKAQPKTSWVKQIARNRKGRK